MNPYTEVVADADRGGSRAPHPSDRTAKVVLALAAFSMVLGYLLDLTDSTIASISGVTVRSANVSIAKVTSPDDGFLVIHPSDGNDQPINTAALGYVTVKAGDNDDLAIGLSAPLYPRSKVFAVLHADTGARGVYEYGVGSTANDVPLSVNGAVVLMPLIAN